MKKGISNKKTAGRGNLVIGLTGPIGSGCSRLADLLRQEGPCSLLKMGDEIRRELEPDKGKWEACAKDPIWRKKLQDHGNLRREESKDQGYRYWVDRIVERVDREKINGPVVIDGIRNIHEVEAFRRTFHDFYLVGVYSSEKLRWARLELRYQSDREQFRRDDARDRGEDLEWGQSVQRCLNSADYILANETQYTLAVRKGNQVDDQQLMNAFKLEVDRLLPLMKGTASGIGPKPHELHMAAAYAHSDASTCMKRHVGAVITVQRGGRELPISVGYNDSPPGSKRCTERKGCHKDVHVNAWFNEARNIHCPKCGLKTATLTASRRCSCGESFREWLWPSRGMELCTAIHAEERAVLGLNGRTTDGGTLYVTTFPCFQCARLLIDAGIKRVYFVEAYPGEESRLFLEENRIEITPFTGFTAKAFFRVYPRVS